MTPEQEEQVRRALAAAAHPDRAVHGTGEPDGPRPADPPMPSDVAARLDEVLAELASEGAVTPLAGRRAARKRRWPRTLAVAAAAAVVVAGGAAAVIGGFGTSSTSDDSSAGSAAESHAGSNPGTSRQKTSGRPQAALPLRPSAGKAPGTGGGPRSPAAGPANGPLIGPALHRATLHRDVARLVAGDPAALLRRAADQPGCRAPAAHAGEQRLAVRLDGRAASLVLGVTTGGRRAARVYSCTDPQKPVATTTVPVSTP